jgi:hypothetical protein
VVAALALGVGRDVVVEIPFVDAEALALVFRAADLLSVLGGDDGGERNVVLVLHLSEIKEHAVDEPEVVAVLQTDDLLALAGGIDGVEAARSFHGEVELQACRVPAADDLAAIEHLRRLHVGPAHLPDKLIMRAVRDGFSRARVASRMMALSPASRVADWWQKCNPEG